MIITSLLDTDLYKFTMMQVVLHHFPSAQVEYRFKCRTPSVNLVPYIVEIENEITHLCSLRFKPSNSWLNVSVKVSTNSPSSSCTCPACKPRAR
jgi:nicotinate phosphoribosyltransferase